ncbi:MAG: SURF1 family protein [Rhizomicrobium sp.]
MRLSFRPLPGLTVAVAILAALLIGLGTWQIERLSWKLGLIAAMNERMHRTPVPVDRGGVVRAHDDYTRVLLKGRFENAKEAYVFTTDSNFGPVYHVLTPFETDSGHVYLVDRGMVPPAKRSPSTRPRGEIEGETRVTGIWRTPDAPGPFTPPPDRKRRIWYARNLDAIAMAEGVRLAAPVVIEADAVPNPGGWPEGGQTVVNLPNNHLAYAMTWFGLAVGLIGVYLGYHVSRGRVGWSWR